VIAFGIKVPPLNAVVALSSNDVWAVGGSEGGCNTAGVSKAVIAHWDGRRLQHRSFPWRAAELTGVAAVSSRDVWAVGSIDRKPLVMHWDGYRWRRSQLPSVQRGALEDVVAVAADDVWAVGAGGVGWRPLAVHWDGKRWRTLDMRTSVSRGSDLRAIDAASAKDVWAAGTSGEDAPVSMGWSDLVLRWNGRRWQQVASSLATPVAQGYFAWAVDIAPSGDVWTVNQDLPAGTPLFVRWSGRARSRVTTYSSHFDGSLNDVAAVSHTSAWSVGVRKDPKLLCVHHPAITHWNGKTWTVQHTQLDSLKRASLEGLSILSPTDVWAVGEHLIARYSR